MKKTNLHSFANIVRWGAVANETHDSLQGHGYAPSFKTIIGTGTNKLMRMLVLPMVLMLLGSGIMAQTPGGVPGVSFWFRADAGITLNGSTVSQWNNQITNTLLPNVAQTNAGLQPTFQANRFEANFNPSINSNGQVLVRLIGTANHATIWGTNDNSLFASVFGGGSFIMMYDDAGGQCPSPAASYPRIELTPGYTSYVDGCSYTRGVSVSSTASTIINTDVVANSFNAFTNGTNSGGSAITVPSLATSGVASQNMMFGAANTGGTFAYNGNTNEILNFNVALTTTQRQQVNSYLAIKYGATLSHNYLASNGTTTTYDRTSFGNNVAGIGKDDNTALIQKQSQSVNTATNDNIITMGLSSIAATNAANIGTFTADKTFDVWGNDNGVVTYTPYITGSYLTRMTRIWKLTETGTVDSVQVAVPTSLLPTMPTGVTSYLVVSNASTLTSPVGYPSTGTGSVKGVPVTFFKVNFPAAATSYFTFATVTAPGGIGGSESWVRADNGYTATTWTNQSDNLKNYSAAGTPTSTTTVNFNPTVSFDGATLFNSAGNIPAIANSNYSKFSVFQNTGTTQTGNIQSSQSASGAAFFTNSSPNDLAVWNSGVTMANAVGGISGARSYLGTGIFNSGVTNGTLVNVDGTNKAAVTSSQTYTLGGATLAGQSGGNWLKGTIAESVVYGSALTAPQVIQVESYLGLKYGITLGHDYKNSANNATYSIAAPFANNVAGIGLDSNTALNQKQSQSINTTTNANMVTMGLTSIATTNALNAATFTTDQTFDIWGDDNGAVTFTTPYTAVAGYSNRMTRVWKLTETGTVGSVRLAVPTSVLPTGVRLVLIVSSAAGLTAPTVYSIGGTVTINTVANTYFDVDFASSANSYFSFAAQTTTPGGVASSALWVRADDGGTTTNATAKGGWVNQSSTNNLVGSGTFQNDATNLVNFNPTVKFAGTNNMTATGLLPAGMTGTDIFSVNRTTSLPEGNVLFVFGNSGSSNRINAHVPWSAGEIIWDFTNNGTDGRATSVPSSLHTTDRVYTFDNQAGAAAAHNIIRNGSLVINTPTVASAAFDGTAVGSTGFSLGSTSGGSNYFQGNITEFIAFPAALLTAQREQVESYLAVKYGQTLPYNYKASDGTVTYTNATYVNNIAGIGRDDNTALYQRQSRSGNIVLKDSMITMYAGTLGLTNQANTDATTFTVDKSFVIWGNDAGVATTTTPFVSPGFSDCANSITRKWKVQRTNTVGAVSMQADLNNTVTTATFNAADIQLVIDRDGNGNFTNGTIDRIAATSFTGGIATFNGINWDNEAGANGSDVFAIVLNKTSNTPPPSLVTSGFALGVPLASCKDSLGYLQFVDNVTTPTVKYAAINPNGNTGYSFTTTASNNNPTVGNQMRTNTTTATTALANRMYTISTTGGPTFSLGGGMTVRIYYDQTDLDNAAGALGTLSNGSATIRSTWFKVPGTVTNVLADQRPDGILNATYLSPTLGTENGVKFAEFTGITTFSTFGYVAAKSTTVLPVVLSSFTAKVNDCKTQLNWVTAQELNSAYYEVQYSTTGNDYAAIGKVASRNSATGASYAYSFANPQNGKGFYRLKMVDSDGKFAYSTIATATANCTEVNITFTPNPVKDILTIRGAAAGSQVQVYTATGGMLTKQVTTAFVTTINTSGYAAGTYMVRVLSNGVVVGSAKLVKH